MASEPASWTYADALAWLYGRQALGIKLGLAKVERLLALLGDPHKRFRSVHIAGTNGKGSVTRMLANALRHAGIRTGATTSPHLVSFTERIDVDGRPIAPADVAAGLARIRPHVDALDAQGEPCTFFEVVTALAFLHFADKEVEWAVVETGMGGRLDATNVLAPRLTIITNVSLDHERFLGDTVPAIALEKAGIMKPGTPLVTAASGPALEVLKFRSHELGVPMSIVGVDYIVASDPSYPKEATFLRPRGASRYEVGLQGGHQHTNAATVLAAIEALRLQGVAVPESAVVRALGTTRHRGRLEAFTRAGAAGPAEILVDGAHNIAAAEAVRTALFEAGWRGFHLVVGFCADKAWEKVLDEWLLPCAHVWAVPVRNPRSLDPSHIVEAAREAGVRAEARPDAASALAAALASGATRILVAGSLFLAGEAIASLEGASLEEIHGAQ